MNPTPSQTLSLYRSLLPTYMDKLQESGRAIIIDPNDPDSEATAIHQIQQRLQQKQP